MAAVFSILLITTSRSLHYRALMRVAVLWSYGNWPLKILLAAASRPLPAQPLSHEGGGCFMVMIGHWGSCSLLQAPHCCSLLQAAHCTVVIFPLVWLRERGEEGRLFCAQKGFQNKEKSRQ